MIYLGLCLFFGDCVKAWAVLLVLSAERIRKIRHISRSLLPLSARARCGLYFIYFLRFVVPATSASVSFCESDPSVCSSASPYVMAASQGWPHVIESVLHLLWTRVTYLRSHLSPVIGSSPAVGCAACIPLRLLFRWRTLSFACFGRVFPCTGSGQWFRKGGAWGGEVLKISSALVLGGLAVMVVLDGLGWRCLSLRAAWS